MAAPQIIINAILYPLEVAYRHGGHTRMGLARDPRRAAADHCRGPEPLCPGGGSQPKTLRPHSRA